MTEIRPMTAKDTDCVLQMMRVFYASKAVFTNGSDEIFRQDIATCVKGDPYLEGYVFSQGATVIGYAMLAKSFSTEFGKPCIWIEDIYLLPSYRGKGIAARFFSFVEEKYPHAIYRLEVEAENTSALRAYQKSGFSPLPYTEMKKP